MKKAPHENPALFDHGDSMHNRHGRQVVMAGMAQRAGLFLIALAFFLLAALLLWNYVLPS